MSFRTRLTGFFVLIVVVPMLAVGVLVFRLIGDSAQGKADARAAGLASVAASRYESASASGRLDAQAIARQLPATNGRALQAAVGAIAARTGLARVIVRDGTTTIADIGQKTAIAPGTATIRGTGLSVTASELVASQYVRDLGGPGVGVVVRQGPRLLGSNEPALTPGPLPRRGDVSIGGTRYRAASQTFPGFGSSALQVTVLSNLAATNSSVQTSQLIAVAVIAAFLLLALGFAVLAARELEGQLEQFLEAARRLGSGDFASRVPTQGRDRFAALGEEFNKMSDQLRRRLEELEQERGRLRESIQRIGQSFESNLDRPALLELALHTAVDAVRASCGRVTSRDSHEEPLVQVGAVGSLNGLEQPAYEAERAALGGDGLGEARKDDHFVASVALVALEEGERARGLITVARRDRAFDAADHDVLRSLAAQATLALDNVELHHQVQRQAVTDELTGLANHGRFQELLQGEIEQVRRYRHPVGLIMLDLDDFKAINDTYGHQQGDVVLRHVARALRDTSREADSPARYGGEEMAMILPHTDLEGSYVISERIRSAIEGLRVPRLDGGGQLRITASLGVTASADGDKDALIADADAALYTAKRRGKNQTVRAQPQQAKVLSGE